MGNGDDSSQFHLGFVGDVMLGRLVDRHHRQRSVGDVWGNLRSRLRSLDGLFINLECCLSKRGRQWTRTHRPFHFRADPAWAIPALLDVGVDCVALANNHILDYGDVALNDTLDHLNEVSIAHAGAGRTVEDARRPSLVSIADNSVTVGFVSVTDNTPEYAATNNSPGTAYITIDKDDPVTKNVIREALTSIRRSDPDIVVASLHWGPNMRTHPPIRFQEFAHWLIDEGVDLIHGHSAHVLQGIEVYEGRPICYDMGDFINDYAIDPDLRNDRSFLYELTADVGGSLRELRLIPTEIRDFQVNEASEPAATWACHRLQGLSSAFETEFSSDGSKLVLSLIDE